jgi:hypothetical protein
MSIAQKILFFFVLPFIAPLLFPPDMLISGWVAILFSLLLFTGLGIFLLRGNSTALTLAIFLQGLNVIVRLMMLYPHVYERGEFNFMWLLTSLLSIGISTFLVLRLDRTDVRVTMVT